MDPAPLNIKHEEVSKQLNASTPKPSKPSTLNPKQVLIWGSGTPRREFLHADDLADACFFLMQHYDEPGLVNIGVGEDISIKELAELVKDIVGFEGELVFDNSKPDGTPRKLMDVSKLTALGWKAKIGLREGIENVYKEK